MKKFLKIILYNLIILLLFLSTIIFLDIKIGDKMNMQYAGYNYKGYRGFIKSEKKKDLKRIVTVGGSTTFGYGTNFKDSYPYLLEKKLNNKKFDVVNLGIQSNRIDGIYKDIIHYEYLDYDLVIIYSGYNDCFYKGKISYLTRHNNFFFKHFNYLPILQTYLIEKTIISLNLNLEEFYKKKKKKNDHIMCNEPKKIKNITIDEKKIFMKNIELNYINSYRNVIEYLIKKNKIIIVLHQPLYGGELQKIQKELLLKLLENFNIYQIDMGDFLNINNKNLFFDEMHLTKEGNSIIANVVYDFIVNNLDKNFN